MYRCVKPACVFLSLLVAGTCLADDFPPPPQPIKPLPQGPAQDVPAPAVIEITPQTQVPFAIPEVPFGKLLRDELLKNLPRELVSNRDHDWGHQAHIKSIQGLKLIEVLRNHGDWEKMTVHGRDVPHRLSLRVDELLFPAADRVAFKIRVEIPADLEFTKQTWQNGVQIYVGHSRARVRFLADIVLETGLKLDEKGAILAHDANGFIVANVQTCCFDFATENVNGLGGDLAVLTSHNTEKSFKRWQASLEREMNDRVKGAFFKTAAAPAVAIGYDRLMTTIASQDKLFNLLTARAPLKTAPLPETEVDEDARPRGRVVLTVLAFAIEMLLNGRSGGSGHASHENHEEHRHDEK